MISAKHYLIVILIALVGLAASTLLMPSHQEIALMEMKDKHFEDARKDYEGQLAQGTMTLVAANHLVDLYIQSGAVDKAVALMEKFSAANPSQLEARAKLGALYQYTQQEGDYLRNLEEINRLKPRQETLKALSDIYNFNGDYDKQAVVLKQLIEAEQGKNAKSFADLADIQAVAHDYAGAAVTLQDLHKRLPEKFTFRELKLLVSLLFDANKPQEAMQAADTWVEANHDPAEGAQLVDIAHFEGDAAMGSALLSHFSDGQINGTNDLLEEYVLLELAQGKDDEAYQRLKVLYGGGRLPVALNGQLLSLAASQGNKKLLFDVIDHTELPALPETQLLTLVELSLARNDAELLATITHAFSGDAARDAHPLLVAALAVSNHEKGADAKLAQLDDAMLPADQVLQMASICVHAKQNNCANHFIEKLPAADTLSDADVAGVGNLYLEMQQWNKGYAWLHAALQNRSSPAIEAVIAQFAAARGDDEQVKAWLDKGGDAITARVLADLYFAAAENRHLPTALMIAEFFHDHDDSPQSRSLLADIDIKTKQFEPAVTLLRDANPRSETDEDNYLAALAGVVPFKPEYRKELADYATARLKSDLSPESKMEIVYVLIDTKEADIAIPALREMAAHEVPDSDIVKELLYMWGPRPTAEQMQWLEKRFLQASGKERDDWGEIISNAASSDFVLGFVARYPGTIDYPKIAGRYFQALLDNGTFASRIDEGIASRNVAWLRGYGRAATENGFRREARKAYDAILAIDSSDTIALREAGIAAGNQADYAASERYLGHYVRDYRPGMTNDPDAYRAFFYYAELLRHNRQLQLAKSYYRSAYDLLNGEDNPTPEMLSMKAQSQVWMGDAEGGLKSFAAARMKYPDNDGLRADTIGMLADLKHYDDARQLLSKPAQSLADLSPNAGTPALPVLTGDVKNYELLEHDSELLLHLSKPVDYAKQLKGVPWISYVNEGYDTLLIVAKPGYKIVVDSAAKTFDAVADTASPASQNAKQTKLRYELLTARIDMETGHIYEATERLNCLLPEYPQDVQLLSLAASAENDGGNWPYAEQLLADARALAPENGDLAQEDRDLRRLHAPNLTFDQEWVHLGSDRESIATLSGYADVADDAQLGLLLQNNYVATKQARLSDGGIGDFHDTRQRGEIYAQWDGGNGQLAKGSLFANDDTLGFGGYYNFLNVLGQTSVIAEWHKPYWEYAEAVLDNATRDRVALLQAIKPNDRLTISGGPGFNRYNVGNGDNVTSAASGEFNATYRLVEGQPFLDLGYGLDAEYVGHDNRNIDSTGNLTREFPLVSHEIHAINLGTGYEFSGETYGEAQAGYAYDRLGGHGPLVGGKLTHELSDDFDVQLHAMYGFSSASTSSSNTVTRFGGSLRWRF